MKRRTIITSVLVIVLCLGLISGSTFALFTSESKVNIAVTSGKVNVVATLEDLVLYSATADTTGLTAAEKADVAGILTGTFAGTYYYDELTGTTFTNGGTATLGGTPDVNVLTIDKITPGDKVKVNVDVKNNSNVAIQYRVRVNVLEGDDAAGSYKLFNGLKVKIGANAADELNSTIRVSAWTPLPAETAIDDIPVEIYLPLEAGNEYQGLTTKLLLTVEAVQGNANTSTLAAINAVLTGSTTRTNKTMSEAIEELVAAGYTYDELKGYVWSVDNDLFYAESDVESSFEYRFFKAYTEMPATQTFSIYADSTWNTASVDNLTVGFDVGATNVITSVTYDRSTATTGRDVVIRTNGGSLTINAPKDVVRHYGNVGTLNIIAAANASYHEHGQVAFAEIATGRFVLENESEVEHIHLAVTGTGTNAYFNDITVAKAGNVDMPEFSRDPIVIPEEGKLVVALQDGTAVDEEKDYVWLTAIGVYEQVTVSDSATSAGETYANNITAQTNEEEQKVADQKQAAQQIANNISVGIGTDTYTVKAEKTVTGWDYSLEGATPAATAAVAAYTVTVEEVVVQEVKTTQVTVENDQTTVETTTTVENGLTELQKESIIEKIGDGVARIGNKYYSTFAEAYSDAKATDKIYILKDFTLNDIVLLDKNTTIEGQNHEIKSSAKRIFRVTQPSLDVKMYDLTMTSICTAADDVRGISFDDIADESSLLLDRCNISASYYVINAVPGADNLNITVKNGTMAAGWAAFNIYSNNSTINIEDSTLCGLNDKTYNEVGWNDFNTITIDGYGLNGAQAGQHGYNNTINIIDSTVLASSSSGNKQYWIGFTYKAIQNVVNVDSKSKLVDVSGNDQSDNYFVSNLPNHIIVDGEDWLHPNVYYTNASAIYSDGNLTSSSPNNAKDISFEIPFKQEWLADGEGIKLIDDVSLRKNVILEMTEGSIYMILGDYDITGTGKIVLQGVASVISDKDNLESLFSNENITVTNNNNGTYTYHIDDKLNQIYADLIEQNAVINYVEASGISATLSDNVEYYFAVSGNVYVEDATDYNGYNGTEVIDKSTYYVGKLVPSVNRITGGAFDDATNTNKLVICTDLITYAQKVLDGNTTIKTVEYAEGVTTVLNRFFYRSSVSNVTLSETITTIEDYAFYDSNITSLVVPEACTYIGYKAFDSCDEITMLDIKGSPNIVNWAGRGVPKMETIIIRGASAKVDLNYVPSGQAKGDYVFNKIGQTNNTGFNNGMTIYVANSEVKALFEAERLAGAQVLIMDDPATFISNN